MFEYPAKKPVIFTQNIVRLDGSGMIKIGVICPSEIAYRRFMPALKKINDIEYVGIAYASATEWSGAEETALQNEKIKAERFQATYGGMVFHGYETMLRSEQIDAVYIPLPPALHEKWVKIAIMYGKHALVEKPFTTNRADTENIIRLAKQRKLALHENYMFVFHNQLRYIQQMIHNGEIGEVRLYQIAFGFPRRAITDFRYKNELGGGAFLDCGGYVIRYSSMLLGNGARIVYANLNHTKEFDVDLYGSGAMVDEQGTTVQFAFGMDNFYQCNLKVWGSIGILESNRIFTAPEGFAPECIIYKDEIEEVKKLPVDDTFQKSILRFRECINNDIVRENTYQEILKQAILSGEFIHIGGENL